jgi:hypothetical protein
MLVDPNTGMPMDGGPVRENMIEAALSADSAAAGSVSGFAQGMGVSSKGDLLDKSLDVIPGLSQTTAWNVRRGFNTMAYGGRGVTQVGGIRATLSPRFLTRLPSAQAMGGASMVGKNQNYIFGASKYKANEAYTPFNILARGGNYAMKKSAGRVTSSIAKNAAASGKTVAEIQASMMETKAGRFKLGVQSTGSAEGGAFSIGTLARITAADKMARGKLPTENVLNFLGKTDDKLVTSFRGIKAAQYNQQALANAVSAARPQIAASPFGAQQAVKSRLPMSTPLAALNPTANEAAWLSYGSVQGSVSGRVAGFMGQMRLGSEGSLARNAVMGTNLYAKEGAEAAVKFMEKGGFQRVGGQFAATKGGELVTKFGYQAGQRVGLGTAVRVGMQKGGLKIGARLALAAGANAVPVVGQVVSAALLASLVMDVGQLGVAAFKSGVDFAKEGVQSYRGQINKGVMGMGYRDNTVAATSRARGVQAIQNSRLNARSVLGSEAGAMHAHFG